MITRKIILKDTTLNLDDEATHIKYYKQIRFGLYELPQNGALLVDMGSVEFADDLFLFDVFVSLQAIGGGMLEGKHLLLYRPGEQILNDLTRVFDSSHECFMYMDEGGVIRIGGMVFSGVLRKSFQTLLDFGNHFEAVTPEDIRRRLKANGPQIFTKSLRQLAKWGFVCTREIRLKRGRPVTGYYPYSLLDPRFLPENVKGSSWDIA